VEECQLEDNTEAKSLESMATEKEVYENSKVLFDLEAVLTLSPNDIQVMKRHE